MTSSKLLAVLGVAIALVVGLVLWWVGRNGQDLYLPDLRGAHPVHTKVDGDVVTTDFSGLRDNEEGTFVLEQRPAPNGSLCKALEIKSEPYPCRESDRVLRYTFEEYSTVGVVRGDTLLVASNLRSEDDPDLVDDAVTALQEAEPANENDLAGD